jgi:hypothetical protein
MSRPAGLFLLLFLHLRCGEGGSTTSGESGGRGGCETQQRTEAVQPACDLPRRRRSVGPLPVGPEALLEVIDAVLALVDGARPPLTAEGCDGGRAGAPVGGAERAAAGAEVARAPGLEQRRRLPVAPGLRRPRWRRWRGTAARGRHPRPEDDGSQRERELVRSGVKMCTIPTIFIFKRANQYLYLASSHG